MKKCAVNSKAVFFSVFCLVLVGCSGGGGGSSTPNPGNSSGGIITTAPTVTAQKAISTPAEVSKTVSSSTSLAMSLVKGGGIPNLGSLISKPVAGQTPDGHRIVNTIFKLQRSLTAVQQKPVALAKTIAATAQPTTVPCAVSGTRTVSYDTNYSNISVSANACKENDTIENGTISISGFDSSSNTFTGANIALNLTTADYTSGGSYTTKTHESTQNMTMVIDSMSATYDSMNMSINGTSKEIDYVTKESSKSTFANFSMAMITTSSTYAMTLNGAALMESYVTPADFATFGTLDTSSGMTFVSLRIVDTYTGTLSAVSIDGKYAIATIPSCMDGTFIISTQIPITTDSYGYVTAGQMTVNGVVMTFNSDGSINATLNGQPVAISATDARANACSLSFAEGIL
jgi:hypothetical protein